MKESVLVAQTSVTQKTEAGGAKVKAGENNSEA